MNLKLDIDFLVLFSDTHCGSQYGLMPPEYELHGGNTIKANPFQRWMFNCWQAWWAYVDLTTNGHKVAIACVGDAIEGIHHGGREVVSPETTDHSGIFKELVRPHLKGRQFVMVEGTECHTQLSENSIGEALGAIPYRKPNGPSSPGVFVWPQVDLCVKGCHGILRHHISVAIRPYLEASAMSIQLGSDRIEAIRTNRKPPQFLVSGHRHRLGCYTDGDATVAILPPWQGLTRHGRKVVPAAQSVVGGVILDFRNASKFDPPTALPRRYVP